MTQPLPGQLSLLACTDDHDARLNVSEGRYQAHSGIVADDAGATGPTGVTARVGVRRATNAPLLARATMPATRKAGQ